MAENTTNSNAGNNKDGRKSTREIGTLWEIIKKHPIIAIIIIITIIIIILSVSDYHNKKKNATEDPNDPKNGPAAANEFINNIYIDENGVLRTEKSVRELWTELKQNGNALTKYLNSPEELAKLFSASIATDFPDTRGYPDTSKSPDDPIDWNKYDISLDSTEVQGIVKFKRALSSNKTITMTYTSPSEFKKKMDKYNKTGKTEDRDEALKYFTIERTLNTSNSRGLINVGSRESYNNDVLNFEDNIHIYKITRNFYRGTYDAVQGCCFDGKYIICSGNKGKHGNVGGRIFWVNAETEQLESSYVDVGTEGGHMEGITYDSDRKVVLCIVKNNRLLQIDNQTRTKIGYIDVKQRYRQLAYSVSTHELIGYNDGKKTITFMKYNALTNKYEEQETIKLKDTHFTNIQGMSCDGQVIYFSDSRPQAKMSPSKYRLWVYDYQGNKVEEHAMGDGGGINTKELENCYVDKNGTLWIVFPYKIGKVANYRANPVDWENSTTGNVTTSAESSNATSSTGSSAQVEEILKYACSWIGKIKYKLGADGKLVDGGKSDCSHFVHRVFGHFGLMDDSKDGFVHSLDWGKGGGNGGCPGTENRGTDMSKASPGDVIWEHYGSGSNNHVYIYLGKDKNGKYKKVQCAKTDHKKGVYISTVNTKQVDAILHFDVLPTDPDAYFDPDTGILHTSSGNTSSSSTASTSSISEDNNTKVSGEEIVQEAEKYVGKLPYVWGGYSLETGADCSGFCWAILKKLGLYTGERLTTVGFETAGTEVEKGEADDILKNAQVGDMIVYGPAEGPSTHMAIYDGKGGLIHETDENGGCKHTDNAKYMNILTIRRFTDSPGTGTTTSTSSTSITNTKYVYRVKVATWQEDTKKVVSTETSENENERNFSMSEITIPYQTIVAQYRMPFNYLWAMLVYSNDKNYIFDLADLVRNSKIEITIHDNYNETITKTTEEKRYNYYYEGKANAKFDYAYVSNVPGGQTLPPSIWQSHTLSNLFTAKSESHEDYKKTTTITNKTNTLDIALTLADTWCVKFEKEYSYNGTNEPKKSTSSQKLDDEDGEKEEYDTISNSSINSKIINSATTAANAWMNGQPMPGIIKQPTIIHNDKEKEIEWYTITNQKITTEETTTSSSYTAKTEKYDLEDTPKFAIVFNRHYNARSNILSAKAWLFEALESNADTANMVDLTKYLMYKATGKNYGATDFLAVFNKLKQNYTDISQGETGGTSGIDGVPGKVYDFLLSKGVPAVGAAAIMGNIENESNFSTTVVNSIGASGLCQWLGGRANALKEFAKTKNTNWTDLNTQLEFMWRELDTSYTKVKSTIMSATAEKDLEYATWYWGSYFEVYDSANQVGYEASRQWKEEKERFADAQKWYYDWKQKHTLSGSSSTGSGADTSTDISQAILSKANANSTPWPGTNMCLQWVDDVYSKAGINPDRKSTAFLAWKAHCISTDKNNIPIGAAVYGTGANSAGAGHVGIYIGNGKVVDSVSKGINTSTLDQWISWQTDTIEGHQGWLGWGWEDGNRTRGLNVQ